MRANLKPKKTELSMLLGGAFLYALAMAPPAEAATKSTDPLGVYSPSEHQPLPGTMVVVENGIPNIVAGHKVRAMEPAAYTETLLANYDICVQESERPSLGRGILPPRNADVDERTLIIYAKYPYRRYIPWHRIRTIPAEDVEIEVEEEASRCGPFLDWVKDNLPWGTQYAPYSMIVDGRLRSGISVLREDPANFKKRVLDAYDVSLKFRLSGMDTDKFGRENHPSCYRHFIPFWAEDVKQGYSPEGWSAAFCERTEDHHAEYMEWVEGHVPEQGKALDR